MPYSDTVFLDLYKRVENGFGRLEEGQRQNRLAAEQRAQHLERQILDHRHETRAELKEIRSDMRRIQATSLSSTNWYWTLAKAFKVLGILYTHWPHIAWVLTLLLGLYGIKNPEVLKALAAKP